MVAPAIRTGLALGSVPALTLRRALLGWRLDPVVIAVVVGLALAYLRGVGVLARRGRRWPRGRTFAFVTGLTVVAVATGSALERYDDVLFTAHAIQHLLLGMVAPLILVLGAPVTLALQAAPRPARTRLLHLLHSAPVKLLTHPLVVWALFSSTLVALYFSPLFELSLRHAWVHAAVHLHFLAAGVLFFWVAVGTDPLPWRLSYPARALFAFTAIPFHAVVGLALVTSDTLVGAGFYGTVARSWGPSPLADQRAAGGILWAGGDLIGVVALLVVVARWLRHEEVVTARADRHLDRHLDRRETVEGETVEKAGVSSDGPTE